MVVPCQEDILYHGYKANLSDPDLEVSGSSQAIISENPNPAGDVGHHA